MENYEEKYKDLIARLQKAKENDDVCDERYCCVIDEIAPELKESEDELTWLTKYIEEEAYSLSMDIRDNEDRIKYEKLQKALAWLEKQCEQKEYTFKSIPRLLDMIEPSDKAKAYCQKLIDTLAKEGYNTDAKIVGECLKQMNGEKVAMATMDEQTPVWSEEDSFRTETLISVIKSGGSIRPELRNEFVNWLKSLKDRVQPIHEYSDTEKQEMFIRSQRPHFWKPSDEQMDTLLSEVTGWTKGCPKQKVLESLYNDLKKLREGEL